jgi:hypothetical protein
MLEALRHALSLCSLHFASQVLVMCLQVEWALNERPLVVHYAGCTFCARHKLAKLGSSILGVCMDEMTKALVSLLPATLCSARPG